MYATNIQWDRGPDTLVSLPNSVKLPYEMGGRDEIEEYLTNTLGIHILGFELHDEEAELPSCPFCHNDDFDVIWDDENNAHIHCKSCGASGPAAGDTIGAQDWWCSR